MSVNALYARLRPAELGRARRDPGWAAELVDELVTAHYAQAGAGGPAAGPRFLDIDRAWDAIRYLLGRVGGAPVDVVFGGVPFSDDESGPGPHRYLLPEDVGRAAGYLRATAFEQLASRFDAAQLQAERVYPGTWDQAGHADLSYIGYHYRALADFFAAAALAGDAVVLWAG